MKHSSLECDVMLHLKLAPPHENSITEEINSLVLTEKLYQSAMSQFAVYSMLFSLIILCVHSAPVPASRSINEQCDTV